MELLDNKVLVTGADGFIGSHLAEALVQHGCDVRAFVFYNSFNSRGWLDHTDPEIRKNLDFFAGDIRDPHGMKAAMRDCDIVFHLAALITIPFSYHSPDAYVDTNVKGTLNVLQAARELDVQRIIHTSTSEVYGTARYVPIDEGHPLVGQSPYAATKIGADQLAISFHRSFGTPVTIVRPFNTYGPRQSARAVIPTIITQLLAGAGRLRLGALYPTRDFNYVDDIVDGFMAAAVADDAVGEVVNLGSNHEVSVKEIAGLLSGIIGKKIKITQDEERLRPHDSEVDRLCASNKKAERLFGWSPRYSGAAGLHRGLEETVDWFRHPDNTARYRPEVYNI